MQIQPTNHLSIQTDENSPDYSALVPISLINKSEEDYITMRLLAPFGHALASKIVHNSAECIEKIFKSYLLYKGVKVGRTHDLEKLRLECIAFDSFFDDLELKSFCENYSGNKKGNNVLRYGFDSNTIWYGLNVGGTIQLVDKYFLGTLALLDENNFSLYNSKVAALFYPTHLQEGLIGNIPSEALKNMRNAIEIENAYLGKFVKRVQEFDDKLKLRM